MLLLLCVNVLILRQLNPQVMCVTGCLLTRSILHLGFYGIYIISIVCELKLTLIAEFTRVEYYTKSVQKLLYGGQPETVEIQICSSFFPSFFLSFFFGEPA